MPSQSQRTADAMTSLIEEIQRSEGEQLTTNFYAYMVLAWCLGCEVRVDCPIAGQIITGLDQHAERGARLRKAVMENN